jgi:hypothetical protein
MHTSAGSGDFRNSCSRWPPHPQPLSCKGRGEIRDSDSPAKGEGRNDRQDGYDFLFHSPLKIEELGKSCSPLPLRERG